MAPVLVQGWVNSYRLTLALLHGWNKVKWLHFLFTLIHQLEGNCISRTIHQLLSYSCHEVCNSRDASVQDGTDGLEEKAYRNSEIIIYKGWSQSNASYFVTLVCNVRGGCRWPGNRGLTFPPIFHYISFLCDRWQQGGSLTWQCVWHEGV